MNDILLETCQKLAKIAACYHLKEAVQWANDGQVLSDDAASDAYFERVKEEATEGMKALGCNAL